MDEFDIPILKKVYEFYKTFRGYHATIPKQDRYTIWQRCENLILDIIEGMLLASQTYKGDKLQTLEKVSSKLDLLRVLVRFMKDMKIIDNKKYVALQEPIDEIGRMLGGWIKSSKDR